MISDQIIEDYIEQNSDAQNKLVKLKVSLFILSLMALIMISLT